MVKAAIAPSRGRTPTRADRRTPSLLDLWLTALGEHQRHTVKRLGTMPRGEIDLAEREQRGNREARKLKKAKVKGDYSRAKPKSCSMAVNPVSDKGK